MQVPSVSVGCVGEGEEAGGPFVPFGLEGYDVRAANFFYPQESLRLCFVAAAKASAIGFRNRFSSLLVCVCVCALVV